MTSIESPGAFPDIENVEIALFVAEGASSSVFKGCYLNISRASNLIWWHFRKSQSRDNFRFEIIDADRMIVRVGDV